MFSSATSVDGCFLWSFPCHCFPEFNTRAHTSILPCLSSSSSSSLANVWRENQGKTRVVKQIREETATETSRMKECIQVVPGLAVILVGESKGSAVFICNKKKACESVGIKFIEVHLAEDSSEQEVLKYISRSCSYNGPYPCSVTSSLCKPPNLSICFNSLLVSGLKKPSNIGVLAMRDREPLFVPCTPKGCLELLHRYGVPIKGKRAAVTYWRGEEDATVSVVHSRTKNPEEITREADILFAAAGQPNMVSGSWIKPGSVVMDVRINPSRGEAKIASAITPVPGGVGPMTIAMLLSNTLAAAKKANNFKRNLPYHSSTYSK
ncbi:UNVERIFIED_CONTAM: Bifunctional protein FolD 4, chloroplastic [Sesamum latifolium]|uniref:Bifunctional protein FolD 4, chloroplastic n=1 Tax=Sesamum latifolium TaxID=2727402 RepID=A0AAW2U6R3_9LAMI